jgi:hypothetical protein
VTLRDTHAWFAWVVVGTNAAAGLWALGAHHDERLRSRWLWRFTAMAQATIFIEVALGVAMIAGQGREVDQFHAFYGFIALAAVGILYSYRQQLAPHRHLLYGFGGLFLMGLALRSITLSPFPVP